MDSEPAWRRGGERPEDSPPRQPGPAKARTVVPVGAAVVVVLLFGLVAGGCSSTSTKKSVPQGSAGIVRLQMGQPAVLSASAQDDGIVSVTVYSLQIPFSSQTDNRPDRGDVFALGDVETCAGSHGANTANGNALLPFPLSLVVHDDDTLGMLQDDDAKVPSLPDVAATIPAKQCKRGYVTFETPSGQEPTAVGWGPPDSPQYEWVYPPS
jgi:hypothetical protein